MSAVDCIITRQISPYVSEQGPASEINRDRAQAAVLGGNEAAMPIAAQERAADGHLGVSGSTGTHGADMAVSRAISALGEWINVPDEGDPMVDVLLGVIRDAHALLSTAPKQEPPRRCVSP